MHLTKKNFKAIIFDCDGTLVDSEHAHYLGWQNVLQKHGSDLTLDEYYPIIGTSTEVTAELMVKRLGKGLAADILNDKQTFYHAMQNTGLPPIESTVRFLQQIVKEKTRLGLKLGVASASKKAEIMTNLMHLDIEHVIDVVISGIDDLGDYSDSQGTNKPRPYVYLHAAKMLEVSPSQCIAIEDSYSGVRAAVDAGCFTIAIPNSYSRNQDLSHAHLQMRSLEGVNIDDFLTYVEELSGLVDLVDKRD